MIFRSLEETPVEIEIPNPEYGYTVALVMQVKSFESGSSWDTFDNGILHDARILNIPGSLFSKEEYQELTNFLNHQDCGRKAFEIELPENSGFFPFGPDLGQSGIYKAHLLNRNSHGMQVDPWKIFVSEFTFILELGHGYDIDYQSRPEGSFQIGSVSGLMFPQSGFSPIIKRGLRCDVTNGRYASAVDVGFNKYETGLELSANLPNAAKLIHEIQTAIRGSNFVMTCGQDYWPFDVEKSDSGSFYCKLLSSNNENLTIDIKHVEYDQFRIPLKVWMGAEL
jgi:hypothetical protein